MDKKIKVLFGIDMETDIGNWTPFYEGLKNGTPLLLDLFDKQDISATFYFTGEAAALYPEIVKEVYDRGHEVGCHSLYHETVGDALFEIPGVKPLLPIEVYERIRKATEVVETALGHKIYSFRAPRLWGSTEVVNALESLGYLTDASYPLYYYRDNITAYHPSADDWTKKGDLQIVELPNFADLSMKSNDEYGRDMDQWPLFRTKGADELLKHINGYIRYCVENNVEDIVLVFYFHPWEFWEMPKGLIHYGEGAVLPDSFIIQNCGVVALKELEKLICILKEKYQVEFHKAIDLTDKLTY